MLYYRCSIANRARDYCYVPRDTTESMSFHDLIPTQAFCDHHPDTMEPNVRFMLTLDHPLADLDPLALLPSSPLVFDFRFSFFIFLLLALGRGGEGGDNWGGSGRLFFFVLPLFFFNLFRCRLSVVFLWPSCLTANPKEPAPPPDASSLRWNYRRW